MCKVLTGKPVRQIGTSNNRKLIKNSLYLSVGGLKYSTWVGVKPVLLSIQKLGIIYGPLIPKQ